MEISDRGVYSRLELSTIWNEILLLLTDIKPKYVLSNKIEQGFISSGLFSADVTAKGNATHDVLTEITNIGYQLELLWFVTEL